MNLTDLLDTAARRASDKGALGNCEDVLVDVGNGRVVYMLVAGGSALGDALYSRDKLTLSDGKPILDVSDEDVTAARERAGGGGQEGELRPVDLAAMPPLVVGPFGHVVAPAMAGAIVNAGGRKGTGLPRPAIDERHADWHWFTHLLGVPVFAERGNLGALRDFVLNPEDLGCLSLVVETDRGELYNFDFEKLRLVSRGEGSLVLDLEKTPPYSVERIVDELRDD